MPHGATAAQRDRRDRDDEAQDHRCHQQRAERRVLAARQRSLAEAGKGGAKSDESEDSYAERISAWITTFFRSAA